MTFSLGELDIVILFTVLVVIALFPVVCIFLAKRKFNYLQRGIILDKNFFLEDWYERCVAKYEGARASSSELYGIPGQGKTLDHYLRQHDLRPNSISKDYMVNFLVKKGHPYKLENGQVMFEGIRQIIFGDVSSGNYGT